MTIKNWCQIMKNTCCTFSITDIFGDKSNSIDDRIKKSITNAVNDNEDIVKIHVYPDKNTEKLKTQFLVEFKKVDNKWHKTVIGSLDPGNIKTYMCKPPVPNWRAYDKDGHCLFSDWWS